MPYPQNVDMSGDQMADLQAEAPILVVDDDDSIRSLFVVALQRSGFKTEEAHDGLQALELLEANDYAAVLLDNHMPNMTGLEVIKRIRQQEALETLPVILVTAASEVTERVQRASSRRFRLLDQAS